MTLDTSTSLSIKESQNMFEFLIDETLHEEFHALGDVLNSRKEQLKSAIASLISDLNNKIKDAGPYKRFFLECASKEAWYFARDYYNEQLNPNEYTQSNEHDRFYFRYYRFRRSYVHSRKYSFTSSKWVSKLRPIKWKHSYNLFDCLSDTYSIYKYFRRENEMNCNLVDFGMPTDKEELGQEIERNAYSLSQITPNIKKGNFGLQVAQIRILLGYTQGNLAEILHTSRQTIVALEKCNSVNNLSDQMLFKVYYLANEVSGNKYLPEQIINISKEVLDATKKCIENIANN